MTAGRLDVSFLTLSIILALRLVTTFKQTGALSFHMCMSKKDDKFERGLRHLVL